MSQLVEMFHNPKCSKSRATLELLRERGVEPTIIEYLKDGLTEEQITGLIDALGKEPAAILRKKEDAYSARGLNDSSNRTDVIAAIVAEPILLERPVVKVGERAAIGRPPENVLRLLDQ